MLCALDFIRGYYDTDMNVSESISQILEWAGVSSMRAGFASSRASTIEFIPNDECDGMKIKLHFTPTLSKEMDLLFNGGPDLIQNDEDFGTFFRTSSYKLDGDILVLKFVEEGADPPPSDPWSISNEMTFDLRGDLVEYKLVGLLDSSEVKTDHAIRILRRVARPHFARRPSYSRGSRFRDTQVTALTNLSPAPARDYRGGVRKQIFLRTRDL